MEIIQTAEILDNLGRILYVFGIIFTFIFIIALVETQKRTYIKIIGLLLFFSVVAVIIGYTLPSKEAYVSSKVLEIRITNKEAYNNLPQVLKDIEIEYYSTLNEK